jgi:RNA polymerase sigma-70 factor (ECF subfamily)
LAEGVGTGSLVAEKSDLELVEAATNGDVDGFAELCRRYYPAMVAIAHSVLGERDSAEDAAQETFARASRKLPQLAKKHRFAAWAAAICRNVAKDMARASSRRHATADLSMVPGREREDDLGDAVREAIDTLSGSARELVFLRYYDGMTYQQISAVLGISQQAINGRLRRAKKNIARYLRRNGYIEVK